MTVATTVLRARSLTKSYGRRTVVNGVDLEVRTGECVGLLGPNGAGKTTTLLMLLGAIITFIGAAVLLKRIEQ